MMQALKQSSRRVIEYPLTKHRAGSYTSPNSISIPEDSYAPAVVIRRRKADGTLRESTGNYYEPPSAYLENDVVSTNVPYADILQFKARYNQVKELMFNFADDTPNIKLIWLRANLMTFSLDVNGCLDLETLDVSDNYITGISSAGMSLPKLNYVYIGGLIMSGMPDPYITYRLQQVASENAISNGTFLSDACVAIGDNAQYHHETLVNRGWSVGHISMRTNNVSLDAAGGFVSMQLLLTSSKYDWEVISYPSWVDFGTSFTTPSGVKSSSPQNFKFNYDENTSGSSRSGNIEIRKLKDDGTEYKGRAVLTVNQS